MPSSSLLIRPATREDAAIVHHFVLALAHYERLDHEVTATLADITAALFGHAPRAFCDLACIDSEPIGFALWFYNYSTFVGKHGIYLEDLFVLPAHRGSGAGRALLADLAARCVCERLGRLEWWVLDWNEPALRFYRSLGAVAMDAWTVQRMTGDALIKLAGTAI